MMCSLWLEQDRSPACGLVHCHYRMLLASADDGPITVMGLLQHPGRPAPDADMLPGTSPVACPVARAAKLAGSILAVWPRND